ncbi:MAG: SpaH/EbpB family LPXTG-anchored major pilin [Micrococcales bacterium]|nr:SpaH/EbpB family LPXTG-anchored major pilin [Micrococcales bacterium]
MNTQQNRSAWWHRIQRRLSWVISAMVALVVVGVVAAPASSAATTPQLGDKGTFQTVGYSLFTIDGQTVYCQEFNGGWPVDGTTYTLSQGGNAVALNPKVVWILVHGGQLTPEQFAAESGISGLTQLQLYDSVSTAIWYFTDGIDPSTFSDTITYFGANGQATQAQLDATNWLVTNAAALAPTSETGTVSIVQAPGYQVAINGTAGPFEVTMSSGVPVVLLSASSGTIVDASGNVLTGVTPGQQFWVTGTAASVTITATGTNVYVPGWTWMPPTGDVLQRISFAWPSPVADKLAVSRTAPTPPPVTPTPTPTPTPSVTPTTPPTPPVSGSGAITVQKYVAPVGGPDGSIPSNGAPLTPDQVKGLQALTGVTFQVKRVVGIDLTSNAGWVAANDLLAGFNTAASQPTKSVAAAEAYLTSSTAPGGPYSLDTSVPAAAVDANGLVTFSNLTLGLYLVEEVAVPAGVTASIPFLISVPMTNPNDLSSWMYHVYAYPKNAVTNVTKSVIDTGADATGATRPGDPVTWSVKADIPQSTGDGLAITGYQISDKLDPALTYSSFSVQLAGGSSGTASDGSTPLSASDYTITTPSSANANTFMITFTPAGLDLLSAHRDQSVALSISTVVNSAVGDIANTAYLFPNQDAIDSDTGVASNTTDTKWGSATFVKLAKDGTAPDNTLAGAVFRVYTSQSDATAGTNPISWNVGGSSVTDLVSGSNGTFSLPGAGLRYSDYADGASLSSTDAGYQTYWLAEVSAPAGYELLPQPIEFTITADTDASHTDIDYQIIDVPHNAGFELPMTGGRGALEIYTIGILILAGAITLLVIARRRGQQTPHTRKITTIHQ